MAQCVERADKRSVNDSVIDLDGIQPKKFKQARLPFQPLDCKVQTPSSAGSASKKRKLSGQNFSNSQAKLAKHSSDVNCSSEKEKLIVVDNDNEVSSSSEAENASGGSAKGKSGRNNILGCFVRRESLQEEITSTNDVIDLTEPEDKNVEPDENSPMKSKSPTKKTAMKSQSLSSGKNNSKKEKSEEGFARKLVFVEDSVKPMVLQEPKADNSPSIAEKSLTDSKQVEDETKPVTDESAEKTTEDGENNDTSMCNLGCEDNSEEDVLVIEEKSEEESTNSEKGEAGDHSTTPSTRKQQLSSSTPCTPASGNTSCSSVDDSTSSSAKKPGQPPNTKQVERAALRQKVKDEKEKQKQEVKEKKEKERLQKKQKRDEEKAEKNRQKQEEKEKKEKERQQKKEQTEKEKQEKQQHKEEERKKKQELIDAKMEEKKKKEEEKRLKEEEKMKEEEEKERQKQKRKEVFESFFIKPKAVSTTKVQKDVDSMFIPFEVKKDMSLAPNLRRPALTDQEKEQLDNALNGQESSITYIKCLKKGTPHPIKTSRKLRTKKESEQEVELIVHDSETVKKVMHAVKLMQFHTDYRPPYYGTWRKKVKHVSPRNPWKKDEEIFDYEVESDEEWEEEEPGESLSDSNDDDEEADAGEEEDDDGWMVPHGYLSEGEGCDDDEEVTPEVLKARQRAKAQAWEAELQAKKQVAPPIHLGCYWQGDSCFSDKDLDILKQFEMVCLRTTPFETLISCSSLADTTGEKPQDKSMAGTTPSAKGFRKRAVPEEAMPDFIRLLHGNSFGIKKLVREFRLYWKRKTSDQDISLNESCLDEEAPMDTSSANTSVLAEVEPSETDGEKQNASESVFSKNEASSKLDEKQIEEIKDDDDSEDSFSISKRQLEIKILAIASREKRPGNSKKCWYVNSETLQQYNMVDLPTENSWEYVSITITKKTPCKSAKKASKGSAKKAAACEGDVADQENEMEGLATPASEKPKKRSPKTPKDQPSITGFACKTPKGKLKEMSTTATHNVEASAEKNVVSTDQGTKPQAKPDQPAMLNFMKKLPAEKVAASKVEDRSENNNATSVSEVAQSSADECIVLD